MEPETRQSGEHRAGNSIQADMVIEQPDGCDEDEQNHDRQRHHC